MLNSFISVFRKTKNNIALVIGSFVVFIMLRIIPVFNILKHSYTISEMTVARKIDLFLDYTLATFLEASSVEQFIVVALSILTVINIILFVVFARRQQKMLSKRSFFASVSGMFLGLFGVGCLSCGVLIMAPLLTFIGLGSYLGNFAQYALWLSFGGMIFVIISILYLLKKISEPMICRS